MKKSVFFVFAAGVLISGVFSGCANRKNADENFVSEEINSYKTKIGEKLEAGFLEAEIFYYPAVDMSGNGAVFRASDYEFHLEADISAGENNLGFAPGSFVPYLTVEYEIKSNTKGKIAAAGTLMVLNSKDGPHYGANVRPIPADSYSVTLKIHSPEEQFYLLEKSGEAAVEGSFAEYWTTETLNVSWNEWNYKNE